MIFSSQTDRNSWATCSFQIQKPQTVTWTANAQTEHSSGHDDLGVLWLCSVCVAAQFKFRLWQKKKYVKITLDVTKFTATAKALRWVFIPRLSFWHVTYLPKNSSESRGGTLDIAVLSGEICLHFQMINLTDIKWAHWFKPASSETPPRPETSSINGRNCFLWHIAGKTFSINFCRKSNHTISCRLELQHHTACYCNSRVCNKNNIWIIH